MEQEIYGKTADLNCEIEVNSNGMMDMSALSGSGIEVDLYGSELNDLAAAGKQVMALMEASTVSRTSPTARTPATPRSTSRLTRTRLCGWV